MSSFHEDMVEFKRQLEKGRIQQAYRGLLEYMSHLRSHFTKQYPAYMVPNTLYVGYMDMTYFPIVTRMLKQKKLKIAVVFLYDDFRFEVWLSGVNKQVLTHYWQRITEKKWDKYKCVKPEKGIDFILTHIVADNPDFDDLDELTSHIEKGTVGFITDVETFLSQ